MKLKRIYCGLSLAGVFLCSSCLLPNHDISINKDLTYEYTDEQVDALYAEMDEFENKLNKNSLIDVVGAWNTINTNIYKIATFRSIERINYDENQKNSEAYAKYEKFQEIVLDVVDWQEGMYQKIYDSSYRDIFFNGYTEEEIQKLLNSKKPERFKEIEKEIEKLQKEADDLSDTDYLSKSPEIYSREVKLLTEEASLLKYDSYLDYAYEMEYNRSYTPKEIEAYSKNLKKYSKDLIAYTEDLFKKSGENTNAEATNTYSNFFDGFYTENKELIDVYADYVGGDFKKSYEFLNTEGYIRMPDYKSENATQGAYTTYLWGLDTPQPIIYFGPGYQNTFTFIHEFGHYNSFVVNGSTDFSLDLAEAQSQGDEMLFMAYLEKEEIFSEEVLELIRAQQLADALTTLLLACAVNEFEMTIYSTPELVYTEYSDVFKNILKEYNLLDCSLVNSERVVEYWKYVCIDNPGYYISYSVSLVPALEIYATAKKDMDAGVKAYTKLFKNDTYDQSQFEKIVKDAGLYTPFEEEAMDLILECFK